MVINNVLFDILEEQNFLRTTKTKPLVDAIVNRHPVTFYYSGPTSPKKESVKSGTRVNGEPVALGLSKKGNLIVRIFIPSPNVSKKGFNKTNWRTFMVSRMSNLKVDLENVFDEQKPQYKEGDDNSMTVTYVTSKWGTSPETTKPEVKPEPIEPSTTVEPTKPEIKPVPKPISEPTSTELPQPKPTTKPSDNPEEPTKRYDLDVYNKLKSTVKDVNGQKVINTLDYQNAIKDLYKRKESDWVEKQKLMPGANLKPGEGTRARFQKTSDSEINTLLHKDGISVSDEQNKLEESLNRIKTLMFS